MSSAKAIKVSILWPGPFTNLIPPCSLKTHKIPLSKSELCSHSQKLECLLETKKTHFAPASTPNKIWSLRNQFLLKSCLICQDFAGSQFLLPGYKALKYSSIMETAHTLSLSDANGIGIILWTQHQPLA